MDGCTVVDSPVVACEPTGLVHGYGDFPDRGGRQTNRMVPQQFGLDALGTKLPLIAQPQNEVSVVLIEDASR